ncbi:MAG: hypothetical protein KF866_01525 [Phycisphaeraceae bacterium]|nr:hypothetical protein [Phycisphaeraceae bacterium]MCW5754978.1 hypothetical protein [Phycisphaeraceae bacterium]
MRSISAVVRQGAFLACSWTWCIGMFLPVLLTLDYGLAAFWVFAVPNVVGAAAMGWILARQGASEAFITRHRIACEAFSAVTRAFHAFFVFWVLLHTGNASHAGGLILAVVLMGVLALGPWVSSSRLQRAAPIVWLLSAAALVAVVVLVTQEHVLPPPDAPDVRRNPDGLLALLPVCIFGFLLCPYLDLTFHRARQTLHPREAAAAFTLGFGVLFFAMILFSAIYGRWMSHGGGAPVLGTMPPVLAWIVGLHIMLQAWFTFSAHGEELGGRRACPLPRSRLWMALVGMGIALALVASWADARGAHLGEMIYRSFMSFYGLAFPAYVWICHLRAPVGMSRRRLMRRWALAVGAAAPMYWVGFIDGHEALLVPGLMIVLCAGLLPGPTPQSEHT